MAGSGEHVRYVYYKLYANFYFMKMFMYYSKLFESTFENVLRTLGKHFERLFLDVKHINIQDSLDLSSYGI